MIPSPQSPLGNTLDRYLLRQFFGIFCLTLLVVMLLHLAGEIFNRVDNFMGSTATLSTAIWFFIYRLPLMVSTPDRVGTLVVALRRHIPGRRLVRKGAALP